MVLAELGASINAALTKLNASPVIDEAAIDLVLKEIAAALLGSDVNVKLVAQLRGNVKRECMSDTTAAMNKSRAVKQAVYRELVRLLTPSREPLRPKKGKTSVFMFVGLQGSGKTTSIAKFANYYNKKGFKCGIVCCDTFRAGALDQVKQNAIKLHIPYFGNPYEADPVKLAEEGCKHFRAEKTEIILVDTSGRHQQEAELFEEMEQVMDVVDPNEVVFVMDSSIGQAIASQAEAFGRAVPIGSVIVTKLDGHARGGGALSAVAATDAPITFIGTGEHFDELERFDAGGFVSRLMGMGDMKLLMEKVNDQKALQDPEMMARLTKGNFSLGDFRQQLQSVMGMGSVSQLMGMIPGMSQMMKGMDGAPAQKNMQAFMVVFDSMTQDELDGVFRSRVPDPKSPGKHMYVFEKELTDSRKVRIARGAGVQLQTVFQLLTMYNQFKGMMGNLGKAGLGNEKKMSQQMQRNPNQLMSHLQKSVDPNVLRAMGGSGNMMEMMKNMGLGGGPGGPGAPGGMPGAGGMPDMGALMKMMQGGMGGMGAQR